MAVRAGLHHRDDRCLIELLSPADNPAMQARFRDAEADVLGNRVRLWFGLQRFLLRLWVAVDEHAEGILELGA